MNRSRNGKANKRMHEVKSKTRNGNKREISSWKSNETEKNASISEEKEKIER